jgi:hypothetical protein
MLAYARDAGRIERVDFPLGRQPILFCHARLRPRGIETATPINNREVLSACTGEGRCYPVIADDRDGIDAVFAERPGPNAGLFCSLMAHRAAMSRSIADSMLLKGAEDGALVKSNQLRSGGDKRSN